MFICAIISSKRYQGKRGVIMKKFALLPGVLLIMIFILTACGGNLKVTQKSSELNDVTATLSSIKTSEVPNGSTVFEPEVTITNNSNENIMEVTYELKFFDKDGNEVTEILQTYNGQDKAIAPGETVSAEARGFQDTLDAPARTVTIEVTKVKNDTEVPPVKLPQKGEYLYEAVNNKKINNIKGEAPVRFIVGIDQGGYLREAVFEKEDDIQTAVDAFTTIKIGDETEESVTDNYNYIVMEWADGTSDGLSLNLHNLEISIYNKYHIYELEDLAALWSLAEANAEEVVR